MIYRKVERKYKMFNDFFPFGTQYHRSPTPLESEWDGDLDTIKAEKYTHIQFRPQWRCCERIRGQFDWSELDKLMDMAKKKNMRAIIKPMLETAPDWVFSELNGSRVGFNNLKLEPISHAAFYVGGWWPCFDNQEVAKAAFEFTYELAKRYANHSALWFFNAWNEPRSRPLGQCCCPDSKKSYREFLQKRFGSIENLNQFYGKAWSTFETVNPPHSHSDYAEMHLWRQWAGESVANQVKIAVKALRAGAPDAKIMCHVGCSTIIQDPICDTSDDMLNAKEVDWYGCSFPVELHPKNLNEETDPLLQTAWMRRVDSNYWIHEFYTNYANWCKEVSPEKLAQLIYMGVANGAKGVTFWQYRSERFGEESNGWGMREMNGKSTARSNVCDEVAKVLAKLGSDFAKSNTTSSEVAILFDRNNDLLMKLQSISTSLNNVQGIEANTNYPAKNALKNMYSILTLNGVNPDIVLIGDELKKYKLLVVNCLELVDIAGAKWLSEYVQNGGTLFIEYPFACRDQNTWVSLERPNSNLDKLIGCREIRREAINNAEEIVFEDGKVAKCKNWVVDLELTTGKVFASYRNHAGIAGVINHYGAGKVITTGGNLSLGWEMCKESPNVEIYKKILHIANVKTDLGNSWRVKRESDNFTYEFIFNAQSDESITLPTADSEVVFATGNISRVDGQLLIPHYGTLILKTKK